LGKEWSNKIKDTILDSSNSSETEASEDTKKGINFNLVKFFTDIGAPECLKKLQKEDLLDPELFFKVKWDVIERVALGEIKPEGRKMKLTKKVKEVKEKYDKEGFIEYVDLGLLDHTAIKEEETAPE
jgi:hypothetical protein